MRKLDRFRSNRHRKRSRSEAPQLGSAHSTAAPTIQFWDTPRAPDDVETLMSRWRRMGRSCQRLDDRTARAVPQQKRGAGAVFDHAAHHAIRAALFRLGYLAVSVGCYTDADAHPSRNAAKTLATMDPNALTLGTTTAQMRLHPQNESGAAAHPCKLLRAVALWRTWSAISLQNLHLSYYNLPKLILVII